MKFQKGDLIIADNGELHEVYEACPDRGYKLIFLYEDNLVEKIPYATFDTQHDIEIKYQFRKLSKLDKALR